MSGDVQAEIVLVAPEIPPNTGNIARTCAATGTPLHIVEPIAFDISDKAVRRAGLDYWRHLNLTIHSSWTAYRQSRPPGQRYACLTTAATAPYTAISCTDSVPLALVFGSETSGLPRSVLAELDPDHYRIPMRDGQRSLNLGNSVAIVLYDVLRRSGFAGLK